MNASAPVRLLSPREHGNPAFNAAQHVPVNRAQLRSLRNAFDKFHSFPPAKLHEICSAVANEFYHLNSSAWEQISSPSVVVRKHTHQTGERVSSRYGALTTTREAPAPEISASNPLLQVRHSTQHIYVCSLLA